MRSLSIPRFVIHDLPSCIFIWYCFQIQGASLLGLAPGDDAPASEPEESEDVRPADYDYDGFSRGSSYHDKKQSGELNHDDGHTVQGAPDKRTENEKGHC